MDPQESGGPSEPRHDSLEEALTWFEASPRSSQLAEAFRLLGWVTQMVPQPWTATFSNDFAALACLARAVRQLDAALQLALFGYYSEVPTLVRGAYESAGLARIVAKDDEKGERWVRQGAWVPDREVRAELRRSADYARFLSDGTSSRSACAGSTSFRVNSTRILEAWSHLRAEPNADGGDTEEAE